MNKGSMTPATLLFQPEGPEYPAAGRLWQGIPAIERTRGGRLFAAWYSGRKTEEAGNFVVVEKSDDDGATWTDAYLVIAHDDPMVRCFDQCLWLDPLGRL
ncbi:MAG TPA: sialidase family protein, partial [Clostridia bacterium]|nr:sialidase family protein [Clostridia bacterium]